MAVDFKGLLSTNFDNIERPKPLPVGTWHGVVTKYTLEESKEKKTPGVQTYVSITGPGEDIDADALTGVKFQGREFRTTFWLTPESMFRIKDFMVSCGIVVEGRSIGECLPELANVPVIVHLGTRPGKTPEEIFNDIESISGTANA